MRSSAPSDIEAYMTVETDRLLPPNAPWRLARWVDKNLAVIFSFAAPALLAWIIFLHNSTSLRVAFGFPTGDSNAETVMFTITIGAISFLGPMMLVLLYCAMFGRGPGRWERYSLEGFIQKRGLIPTHICDAIIAIRKDNPGSEFMIDALVSADKTDTRSYGLILVQVLEDLVSTLRSPQDGGKPIVVLRGANGPQQAGDAHAAVPA